MHISFSQHSNPYVCAGGSADGHRSSSKKPSVAPTMHRFWTFKAYFVLCTTLFREILSRIISWTLGGFELFLILGLKNFFKGNCCECQNIFILKTHTKDIWTWSWWLKIPTFNQWYRPNLRNVCSRPAWTSWASSFRGNPAQHEGFPDASNDFEWWMPLDVHWRIC